MAYRLGARTGHKGSWLLLFAVLLLGSWRAGAESSAQALAALESDAQASLRDDAAGVRERPVPELYRRYVVAGAAVFLAQLALILGLLFERALRRRAERDAQRSRDELYHLSRVSAMGELTASLAHELNQPLTAILSNARAASHLVATHRPDLPELRDILDDIVNDNKRAGEVISRVRDLVSKHPTERSELNVNDLVQGVVKLATTNSTMRQVPIALTLATEPLFVEGDRVQLQQVFLNLLLNALEATSSANRFPRRVTISTDALGRQEVRVVVTDNGPGLPVGDEHRVFEPFFTTKDSGMGMGLAIARSIVTSHGGTIWAVNVEDDEGGAGFHLTLPRLPRSSTASKSH